MYIYYNNFIFIRYTVYMYYMNTMYMYTYNKPHCTTTYIHVYILYMALYVQCTYNYTFTTRQSATSTLKAYIKQKTQQQTLTEQNHMHYMYIPGPNKKTTTNNTP